MIFFFTLNTNICFTTIWMERSCKKPFYKTFHITNFMKAQVIGEWGGRLQNSLQNKHSLVVFIDPVLFHRNDEVEIIFSV